LFLFEKAVYRTELK